MLKKMLYGGVEQIWRIGYGLTGRLRNRESRERAKVFRAAGGQRVVIVAPHPDDETIATGGVAQLHLNAGDQVISIIVTDGRNSKAEGLSGDEMAARRRQEAEQAAETLGIDLCWLGLPEGHWDRQTAESALQPLLADADIIYAPSCVDFHPEHLRVAALVARVVKSPQTVRIVELGVPLTGSLVNLVANIKPVADLKEQALADYDTQKGAILPLQRLAAYRSRYYRFPEVEAFWEVSGEDYRRIVKGGDWREKNRCAFRGVRATPLGDPLAWIYGRAERLRLRHMVRSNQKSKTKNQKSKI